jgi:hypothetical protein
MFAVKSKRAARKRNNSDILNLGRFLLRLEPRDTPILVWLLCPPQDVDHSINKYMATDLRADVDLADDAAARVELQDPMFIPLAQVEMLAVVAEI